jgi:hypothetical protein
MRVPVVVGVAGVMAWSIPLLGDDKVSDVIGARAPIFRVDFGTYRLNDSGERHSLGVKERSVLAQIIRGLKPATSAVVPPPKLPLFPDTIEVSGLLGSRKVVLKLAVTPKRSWISDEVEPRIYDVPASQVKALDALLTPSDLPDSRRKQRN